MFLEASKPTRHRVLSLDTLKLKNGSAGRWCRRGRAFVSFNARKSRVCHACHPLLTRSRTEVIVCEANDERKTSRLIPLLLVSRTMEIYETLGLAEEIKRESEK